MNEFVLPAIVSCIYVFMRAFQQLNVVNRNYWMVMPTSVIMGIGDVLLVLYVVKLDNLWLGVTNGVAAGVGCCAAMWVSHKFWGKK